MRLIALLHFYFVVGDLFNRELTTFKCKANVLLLESYYTLDEVLINTFFTYYTNILCL